MIASRRFRAPQSKFTCLVNLKALGELETHPSTFFLGLYIVQ